MGRAPSLLTILSIISLLGSVASAATDAVNPSVVTSTGTDRQGVAVTIYNAGLGLVKERRKVALPAGTGELRFMDVAAQVIPASVQVTPLGDGDGFRVLEQNYEYDLLNPQKLLDKYVGKEVRLYQKNPYSEREETVAATLLANNGGPVFRIGNEVTFGHPGRVIFPGVPDSLIAKPTLVWLLESGARSPRELEVSYLTNGITWRADYVVTLDEQDKKADLAGWVTIDNRSGAAYQDAVLKLVAGDVNRVREDMPGGRVTAKPMMAGAAPQFREEGFFEYHLYTLQRPATVKDNQTKQISLLAATGVPVRKEYLFRGADYYYQGTYPDLGQNQKVGVFVELANRKAANLGLPLPKGVVRVYKRDAAATLQFIGEDAIDHTPVDETVRVKLGDVFDVVGSRKQTEWRKLASDTFEAAFELRLRNHKDEAVTVKVVEPIPGDWQMLSSSIPHKKGDAATAEFLAPVPAKGETVLTYRVRIRY
ncbi:MAG TPA: DUF4139 domain-containing protein [Candidatus Methylomirabilis sp.]|nr:DUF4139 domain-containing protein [Candidatus Methylomirabilis sp.]